MSKLGHEQPELDNMGHPEGSLFSPFEEDKSVTAKPPEPENDIPVEIRPVAEIMAEHERRVDERAARWEELTDKNWPPNRIREILDQEFPDLKTPEDIEKDEIKRIVARRHASRLHEQKPKRRPTRYVSPRDTGPPLHIAEEVRRDQGLID